MDFCEAFVCYIEIRPRRITNLGTFGRFVETISRPEENNLRSLISYMIEEARD